MLLKCDQQRVKSLLTEAIMVLCKTGLSFKSEFCIEGLLGITLDSEEIFLVNIKETVNKAEGSPIIAGDQHDQCSGLGAKVLPVSQTILSSAFDLGLPNLDSCHIPQATVGSFFCTDSPNKANHSTFSTGAVHKGHDVVVHDLGKVTIPVDKHDKVDTFPLSVADMTYAKLGDLDMLLGADLSRKRDSITDDPTSALFNESEIEQIMSKADASNLSKDEDDDELSDMDADIVLVKQEQKRSSEEQRSKLDEAKHDLVSMDTLPVSCQSELVFAGMKGDDQLPGCSAWDQSDSCMDAMPLNLSEPQPQDLTTHHDKKKEGGRVMCIDCGKKFKSEQTLSKHRDKEHPEDFPVLDMTSQPLSLIKDLSSKPLDLTVATRGDSDELDADLDGEFAMYDQEQFACICSKVYKDYESYIDHVANCNKARLTPYKACDICGKYFFSHSGYVKHKRLHVGNYKFRCNICHKGFFDRTHMRAHMDSSHNKVRRYECNFCEKSFFWKHHLKRHLTTCDRAKALEAAQIEIQLEADAGMELASEDEEGKKSDSSWGLCASDGSTDCVLVNKDLTDIGDEVSVDDLKAALPLQ